MTSTATPRGFRAAGMPVAYLAHGPALNGERARLVACLVPAMLASV
jgi:hypothetical protein